jgi:hypothetical protein
VVLQQRETTGSNDLNMLLVAAVFAFILEEFKAVITTADKTPMMAITTKSSINVKPFCKKFFIINI